MADLEELKQKYEAVLLWRSRMPRVQPLSLAGDRLALTAVVVSETMATRRPAS